ncbi:hypothetical protein HanRHA438_Chr12g0553611 [Helianthus annuus]|nr:hypothetical protein HanRHA438_Chr12g0553611 [Helianthus annuus]
MRLLLLFQPSIQRSRHDNSIFSCVLPLLSCKVLIFSTFLEEIMLFASHMTCSSSYQPLFR